MNNTSDTVCPEITLLSGDSFTLPPCRTVQDIKVQTSLRFPEFLPPDIIVLDENHIAELKNDLPAPMRVSVVLQEEDRNQRLWELAFEAFSFSGDLERASACLEEVKKWDPEYDSDKLFDSATDGKAFIVRALIFRGVDINSVEESYQQTAIMFAAENGRTQVVQMLIENNASVDMRDSNQWSAMIFASFNGHTQVAQMLIKNSAGVDARDSCQRTALIYASRKGHTQVVQMLIENSASVDASDIHQETALIVACYDGRTQIAQVLIENSASVDAMDRYQRTALMRASPGGHTQIVQMLIENNASVNMRDSSIRTALISASSNGHTQIAQMLIENGAIQEF